MALAVWAHVRREPDTRRTASRALLVLAGGIVGARALRLLIGLHVWSGADAGVLALRALIGLATWGAVIVLLGIGHRRRDLWMRIPTIGAALLLGAFTATSAAVGVALTVPGLRSFRWKSAFPTRVLLRLLLAAVALLVLMTWSLPPATVTGDAGRDVARFGSWSNASAFGYLVLMVLSLLVSMVRDPSLGIRTVGRRLALSHVLVVIVPLALTVLLWMATTVLGVSTDRARVAAAEIAAEADGLHDGLSAALPAADARAALSVWAAAHAERWPRASVWLAHDTTWTQVAGGDDMAGARLRAWADSLDRLPDRGFVAVGDSIYLGALVRTAERVPARAVVLVPVTTLLPRQPGRVAQAQLVVTPRLVPAGGTFASAARDSSPVQVRRQRQRITITTGQDTFASRDTSLLATLGSGRAVATGLRWRRTHWVASPYLITASLAPHAALAGLLRGVRESPLGVVPVVLLGLLAVVFLLVAAFDVVMVTGMGRSIAAAIEALRVGAERLEAGDLAHRIAVKGDDDLWGVASAFNTASAGLERAREREQEQSRIESELALARQIQARLLPRRAPRIAGLEIAGLSVSARHVGGDYYDHIDAGDGRALLVIADVSGKGVPAALLMSGVRASVMSQDLHRVDAPALAARLNEFVAGSVEPGRFVTAFVAWIDAAREQIEYVNAGHNPPLLVRADGTHEELATGGLILGIVPETAYARGVATWQPGDRLVLYTDGVTEAANAADEMWGEERLLAAVRAHAALSCEELVRAIAAQVRAFEGDRGPADDVTLLAARRSAPG